MVETSRHDCSRQRRLIDDLKLEFEYLAANRRFLPYVNQLEKSVVYPYPGAYLLKYSYTLSLCAPELKTADSVGE